MRFIHSRADTWLLANTLEILPIQHKLDPIAFSELHSVSVPLLVYYRMRIENRIFLDHHYSTLTTTFWQRCCPLTVDQLLRPSLLGLFFPIFSAKIPSS